MSRTLRLLMPEWQGGDYDLSINTGEIYPLGTRLLDFLAPCSDAETVEVPVAPYRRGMKRDKEHGVLNQEAVIKQVRAAQAILDEFKPDKVVTFGGECLVSQAPFDYLNGRYQRKFGVLWIDAHPDISTPANHDREHAMVLGNLLGGGDPFMAREVRNQLRPEQVLLVGMSDFDSPKELENINNFGLQVLKPEIIWENSDTVIKWLEENKIENLAIHLDLDSLNPKSFYSQMTNDPDAVESYDTVHGKLNLKIISRLLKDIDARTNIVGLTFAEFFPWDAYNLKKMMGELPIMNSK